MPDIEANPDALQGHSDEIRSRMGTLDTALGPLSAASGTLAAQWTGDAANAYAAKQAGWLSDMQDVVTRGRSAAEAVASAATAYREADDAVGALWSL